MKGEDRMDLKIFLYEIFLRTAARSHDVIIKLKTGGSRRGFLTGPARDVCLSMDTASLDPQKAENHSGS